MNLKRLVSLSLMALLPASVFAADQYSVLVEPQATPQASEQLIENIFNQAKNSVWLSIYLFVDQANNYQTAPVMQDLKTRINSTRDPITFRGIVSNFSKVDFPTYGAKVNAAEKAWCDSLSTTTNLFCEPSSTGFTYSHSKYMVVDGSTAYIMTMNFAPEDFDPAHTRNFIVVDHNPSDVSFVKTLFQDDEFNADNNATKEPNLIPANFVLSPVNTEAAFVKFINQTKYTLDIYTMYFSDHVPQTVLTAIESAVQRGVTVRILANDIEDTNKILAGLKGVYYGLVDEDKDNFFIHAKAMVKDAGYADADVLVGSTNMSYSSFMTNRELNIISNDSGVVNTIENTFKQDWARFGGHH